MANFWNKLFPPSYSSQIILGPEGLVCKGDKLNRTLLNKIKSTLQEVKCEQGSITLKKTGTISFSPQIPHTCHQRIRNCIHLQS